MAEPVVRWLQELEAQDVRAAGQDAVRLALLRRHGLPTHEGFVITTHVYRRFSAAHGMSDVIRQALARLDQGSLSQASLRIRERILGAPLSKEQTAVITAAARKLQARLAPDSRLLAMPSPVHVRAGSAEADDSDLLYHGVETPAELLLVMRKCWAACWRERSLHQHLRDGDAWFNKDIAVLVLAGLRGRQWLRTYGANPFNGDRRERVTEVVGDELEVLTTSRVRGLMHRHQTDGRILAQAPWPAVPASDTAPRALDTLVERLNEAQTVLGRTLRLDWTQGSDPYAPAVLRVQALAAESSDASAGAAAAEAADRLVEFMPLPPLPVERTGMGSRLGFEVRRRLAAAGVAVQGRGSWWRETERGLTCRLPRVGGGWQRLFLSLRASISTPLDLELVQDLPAAIDEAERRLEQFRRQEGLSPAQGLELLGQLEETWDWLARAAGELTAADRWARQLLAWLPAGKAAGNGLPLADDLLHPPPGLLRPAAVGRDVLLPPLSRWPSFASADEPAAAAEEPGDGGGGSGDSRWTRRLRTLWWQALWVEDVCGAAVAALTAATQGWLAVLGQALAQAGLLQVPDDIFYLTWDELAQLGSGPVRGLTPLQIDTLPRRRDAWMRAFLTSEWQRFGLSSREVGQPWMAWPDRPIRGQAWRPGAARGPAAIVTHTAEAQAVQPGSVVVLARTEPKLVQALSHGAGFIVETEGRLSQLVQLARRHGAPIITGVRDATRRLAAGTPIVMSGTDGSIRRVRRDRHPKAESGGS